MIGKRSRSLTLKLALAFLAVSLAGVALVALLIWAVTSSEFDRFLLDRSRSDFVNAAALYYENNSSWSNVNYAFAQQGLAPRSDGRNLGGAPGHQQSFVLIDQSGRVLIGGGQYRTGELVGTALLKTGSSVTVNGQVVGTVLATGNSPGRDTIGLQFLSRINQALVIAALVAAVLAVLLGFFLARTLTRPLRDLTSAARAMARGETNLQVPVRSKDEMGELTSAFNQLSSDLDLSNHIRRQMVADIAHDLRTPLTVILGYLEGIREGVLKPTQPRMNVLYTEAQHLNRLIDDLRTLSLADAGELSLTRMKVAPGDLLKRIQLAFQGQASQQNVDLKLALENCLGEINIDPDRMTQVLGNLVSNALRYTPEGGVITLGARRAGDRMEIVVQDTGSGIAPDVLPHIFERFFRGDRDRQQTNGESGLGLAIARSIVELHGGKISASSEGEGKGSAFTISLPA